MYIQPTENDLKLLRSCACNVEIDEVPTEFSTTENCTHMTFWSCPENSYQLNLFKFSLNMVGNVAYIYDFEVMSNDQFNDDRTRYEKFLFLVIEEIEKYCKNTMSAKIINIYTEDVRILDAYFEYEYQIKIHTGEHKKNQAFIGYKTLCHDKALYTF